MKWIYRHLLYTLSLTLLSGTQLFWEDFSNDEIPPGWDMELNWQVGSTGYQDHVVGDPPPGAFFYWTPSQNDYEGAMTTPVINVGDEPQVLVEFFFELDFWSAGSATNGLRIEYLSGGDWVTVLSYEISPSAGDVDLSGRYESFTADVNGDFQIRWVAYGTNSTYINSWDVDNIKVSTLPKLTYVNIESSNEDPSTAYEGTDISLKFTADSEITPDPYVQINGTPCTVENLGGTDWVATYSVQPSDPDGPLQFTIDFIDNTGVEGKTVKETTDGSTVIVDNSDPPSFTVGAVTATGGTVESEIWNSTNTEIQLEVNIPEDSAVTSFSYTIGNSLLFNGMNDEVAIFGINDYQATDALTIEAWIKPNSWNDYDGILSYAADQGASEAGFGFVYFATGWRFFLKTTSNSIDYISMAEVSTPSGQWTHLAATYDGEKVRIYRNGSAIDSTDAMGDIQWSGAPSDFKLGSFTKDGSSGYFNGQIDDVRIWNIVRTGVQIKASRETTIDKNEAGLVGYWQMDAGSGVTATDSTSTGNHGIINGATWVVEDSPLNFQAPVYDTGVIVGSAFQLRGRFNTNDFEEFGAKDTITVDDLNAGIKTVSASSDAFEAITDFAHEETAQLSAFLFDVTGNYSSGDTSVTNTVIDIVANSPTPVSISSGNTFSHLAKTGDVVTVPMTYDEDVEVPDVTFHGFDADTETDLGGETFQALYTLSGNEPEGEIDFSMLVTDYLGNQNTYSGSTDGSTVVYDKTIPTLSPVSIASNNADTTWAKANDSISVTFTSSEDISADFALSFDGDDDYIELPDGMVSSLNNFTFICWFNTDVNDPWTRLIDFGSSTAVNMFLTPSHAGTNIPRFAIKQSGGGEQQITSSSPLNQGQWYHIAVTIDDNTNTGKMYLDGRLIAENNSMTIRPSSLGNTTNNYFGKSQYNDPYLDGMMDDISIWGRTLDQNEIQSSMYTSLNGDENGLISYWGLNEGSGGTTYDKSSNTNDGVLNNMDPTSAWFFQRGSVPTATIMSQDASISTINNDQFRADYTTTITDPEGEVQFGISFADLAGNDGETVISTTNNSHVIFDRTAPADFTLGIITANGGNVVENAWNSTNTGLDVTVPVESDTTLKNGWIQVWTKVGINAFEKLGDSTTIANSDVGTDKVISFTSEQVEAITGFAEEDTLTIKAILFDRPGNETEGSQSINRLVIDQVLPTVLSSHIESNNADSTKSKVDNIVTITFQTDEIIQSPSSTISGGAATITDLGSFNWSAVYTMTNEDDEGVILFTVDSLVDARGNPASGFTTLSDGSEVVFDRTKPELDQVQAQTNNTWNNLWALEDEYARLYINASEDLLSINCTFNGLVTTNNQYGPDEYDLGYTFSNTDTEGLVAFEIVFVDSAGNAGDTVRASTDNTYIVFDKTAPSGFTVGNVSATGGNVVSTFWNSTNTDLDVIVPIDSDSTLDSGRVQIWAKVGANNFEMLGDSSFILSSEVGATKTMSIPGESVRAITGYTENDTISLKAFIFDIPGNETVGTESSSRLLIDETPPSLISASYESNFSDSSLATVGHVVTLTFETDVEIQTPSATISTQNAIISDLGSNRWSASYEMQDDDTEGVIPFQIGTLTDSRGNPTEGTSSTTNGTIVTFDNTKPTLSPVKIVSNNADSSWAKVGDTITVEFIGNELLTDQSATIVTQTAAITSTGFPNFYSLSFDGIDDEVKITGGGFISGNEPRSISVWADGSSGNIVSLGDGAGTSNQRFSILISSERRVLIIGQSNDWHTNYYLPQNQMTHLVVTHDGSTVKLYANGVFQDQTSKTYNTDSSMPIMIGTNTDDRDSEYFNGIIDIVIITRDALSIGEVSALYNGSDVALDNLIAKFNFNEGSGSVAYDQSGNGNNGTIYGAVWTTEVPSNTKKYYAKYVMIETDPEGEVPFEIVVTDSVGLVSDPVTQTTDESLVIFDRTTPTLSPVHIESDNANNTLIAIGGDNVYLTFTPPLEPLLLDSIVVTIAGLATTLTESDGSYTATLTLTGSEPDGILEFTIDFKDRAGNPGIQVTATTDESYVNHDIYPPEIEIASITSNNSDSTWAKVGDSVFVTFTASEILDDISITIAGVSSNYNELSLAKYQGYHVMDDSNDEGNIPFLITYADLGGAIGPDADTTTNNTNVQFDKTVPEISLIRMATNNIYGDSLAGIGSVDTLSFTISEVQNDLSVELAGSEKTPSQDGLNFSTTHTFIASDIEGWVDFSISMTDSAGNPSDTFMISQDGSQVRFDGTLPILDDVNFFSNNSNDSSLCIPGDSLFLQYTSRETLRTTTITLAGNSPDESGWLDGFNYYASYILTGTEDEGFIPFTIGFEDWVGNPGDTISGTTNGSSVLFDMTPPDDFTLGDVVSKNGIEVAGYWNASNQTLEIVIPVPNDETLPGGGIQFQASFGGTYSNLADTVVIDQSDLGMGKIVSISETYFESIPEFNENANATFQAVLWDKAGNTTIGIASTSTIHIDQTIPILGMVSQRTNNAIADSLAKVGDTDTLIVSSTEGLDTLQVQIFSQDAVNSGTNRDWTFTYSFQETDNDGMVSFNIVFGDTAGNLGTDVSTTTDGSTVRFDGTKPALTSISFSSTNLIDGGLAIPADTLYLDFISDEDLLTKEVLIAGFDVDTTFENVSRTPFRSWRIMDGTEPEGYIQFEIGYSDLVGNIGDTVDETTNQTSILFDMTPPDDFEFDTVFVSGGKVIFGYWNASNDTLTLRVPIPEEDATLIGGTFQSQVRFGEGTYVNIGQEKIIIGGDGVISQDLKITRMEFTTVAGYSENLNAQFITKAKDRAGNETVGSAYNTTFHIDEIVPSLTEVLIQSNNELDSTWAKISDVISLNFTSSEGLSFVMPVLYSDSLTGISENAGSSWIVTKTILSDNAEGVIPFYITYNDTAGNDGDQVSSSTDGKSVTLDKTNPTITSLLEGNEGLDIDYYNQADSITLYWSQFDSLAGVKDAYVGLGTDSNLTDVLDWTLSNQGSVAGLGGLSLSNDGIYFGAVFVRDSAGNHSDTLWGNSIYIDTQNPDTGSVIDAYWVMDLDYAIDSTRLSYIWSNFTDNTEIDYFEIAIGTEDDTTNVMNWMRSDSTDSMTVTELNLVRDTLYYSYIRAFDLATNKSLATRTDGVYFDDSFPVVNKITPNVISDSAGFLSVLANDTLTIKFNRPIYVYGLSVNSNVDSNLTISHEYGDSIITVIWTDTLASYDTLTVIVDSAVAYNTLWLTDTLHFYSKLWADLNNDYDITIEDILTFNQTWPETDLGPFKNDPPHVRPEPDGEANLTDLAAFGKMWHWRYRLLELDTTLIAARSTDELKIIAQGSKAKITIPKDVAMAEILIGKSNLDIEKMHFVNPSGSAFMFTSSDTANGLIQFSMADHRGFDSTLTLIIPETEQEYFQAQIQYKFMDITGVNLADGIASIDVEILPDKFMVYNNYPNPFNPITAINYDLPEVRDVNIIIYDLLGRTIRHLDLNKVKAGRHEFVWHGTNDFGKRVSTGIYFLQITAGQDIQTQKMLLLK